MVQPTDNLIAMAPARASRWQALAAWIDRHARVLLAMLVLGYIVVVTLGAILKFQRFGMGFDLALIQQAIWNTIHGRPFETYAYDFTNNLLGTDSFFVLLIFVPFYALFPNPVTLLAIQTLVVGTAAIPVYLLARTYLKQRWAALAMAAIYLSYLPVMWGNLYEIRERVLAMAWFLWLLLCIERRWYGRMLVPLVLALSCRLDTTYGVALVGCYALLRRWPDRSSAVADAGRPPIPWRFGLTLIGSALAWNLFVTNVMIPQFTDRPSYLFLEHYSYLGATPTEIVLNVALHPLNTLDIILAPGKLWYLFGMFLPLLFLPLLNWRLLLVMAPLYGLNLLSPRKIQWDVYHHYQGLIVPLMILATILGLAMLVRWRVFGARTLEWCIAAIFCTTLLSQVLYENELTRIFKHWRPTERDRAANTLAAAVPEDAAVAVGNLLAPHLAPRRKIFLVPGGDFFYVAEPFRDAQYALVDLTKEGERKETEAAIAEGGWCVQDKQADYVLLKQQPQAKGESCAP